MQSRDFEILSEIFESPACTRTRIAAKLFDGRYEAAKKRLQQLHRAGLIENNDNSLTGRSILRPTRAALEILGAQPRMMERVSSRMQKHELMLGDVISALRLAAERQGLFSATTIGDDAGFSVGCWEHSRDETVIPDAFFTLQNPFPDSAQHFFFVEADRSTETQGHLVHLANQYRAYQRSGEFGEKRGHTYDRRRAPFRVLLVVKTRERLLRTGHSLRFFAQIGTLVWIATLADVLNDPFGAIWFCPLDFEGSSPLRAARTLF